MLLESAVTDMIHQGALPETLNQRFNSWSRFDTFIQAGIEKIVTDPSFIAPVAVFVKQRVINAVEEELNREHSLPKEILSPPDRSLPASSGTTLEKKSKARHSRYRQHNLKYRRYHNSSSELRHESKKHRHSWSLSFQACRRLKKTSSNSSNLRSRSRSRSSDCDKREPRTHSDEENLKVITPANHHFQKGVNFHTYCLVDTETKFDRKVSNYIANMVKHMNAQMNLHTFDSSETISIIGFLKNVKLPSDTYDVHEGAVM